jgi:preprotein translocase subunit SecY
MIATMMMIATWTGAAWWGAITVLAIIMALAAIYNYFGSAGILIVFVLVAMGIAGAIQ